MLKLKIFSLLATVLFVLVLILGLSSKPTMAQDDSETVTAQLSSDEIEKLAQKIIGNNIDVVALESEWETYSDPHYGFMLQYPASPNWQQKEMWRIPNLADTDMVAKRISFFGTNVEIAIDIFEYSEIYPGKDEIALDWVVRYAEMLRYSSVEDLLGVKTLQESYNANVAGQAAIVFIETNENSPNVLSTVFSNGQTLFRVHYVLSDGGLAWETYLHILETFMFSDLFSDAPHEIFQFPIELKKDISQNLAPTISSCCGYTDSGNPFPCSDGNCTWWVYYKTYVPFRSDAWRWGYEVSQYAHWYKTYSAQTGSVAWYDRWRSPAGGLGHVAYVSGVNGNSVSITEMTWQGSTCANESASRTINRFEPSSYLVYNSPPP